MKKIRILLMLLLVAVVLAPGCKDDDDDKTPSNQMTIAGNNFELSQAFIMSYGQLSGEGYNFDLTMFSPGLTMYEVNGEIDSVTGIGHALFFEIFSASENMLSSGDYSYDADETEAPGTFDFASAFTDYDPQTEEGTEYEIISGKLTVVNSSDAYTFTFEGVTDNGKAITSYYKGVPKIYDFSDDTKSAKASSRMF